MLSMKGPQSLWTFVWNSVRQRTVGHRAEEARRASHFIEEGTYSEIFELIRT